MDKSIQDITKWKMNLVKSKPVHNPSNTQIEQKRIGNPIQCREKEGTMHIKYENDVLQNKDQRNKSSCKKYLEEVLKWNKNWQQVIKLRT